MTALAKAIAKFDAHKTICRQKVARRHADSLRFFDAPIRIFSFKTEKLNTVSLSLSLSFYFQEKLNSSVTLAYKDWQLNQSSREDCTPQNVMARHRDSVSYARVPKVTLFVGLGRRG